MRALATALTAGTAVLLALAPVTAQAGTTAGPNGGCSDQPTRYTTKDGKDSIAFHACVNKDRSNLIPSVRVAGISGNRRCTINVFVRRVGAGIPSSQSFACPEPAKRKAGAKFDFTSASSCPQPGSYRTEVNVTFQDINVQTPASLSPTVSM